MWLIGAVLGAILGAMIDGASLAYVFGLVGAGIGAAISSKKKKSTGLQAQRQTSADNELKVNANLSQPQQSRPGEQKHLIERIELLEQRLAQVERALVTMQGSRRRSESPATTTENTTESQALVPKTATTPPKSVPLPSAMPDLVPSASSDKRDQVAQSAATVLAEAVPQVTTTVAPEKVTELNENTTAEPVLTQASKPEATPVALEAQAPPPVYRPQAVAKKPVNWKESLPAPIANFIFGGNWLVKSGLAILFLGLAFLLRYTSDYFTVPIEFRYAGVAAAALGAIVLGWRLRHKNANFGLSLQGLGIGTFYLTTLFALKLHHLIDHLPCFVFLFLLSVSAAALAVLQKAPVLATVASLAGFATPVLSGSGENNPHGLFTYLAILDFGICIIAWSQTWRFLNLIGFFGTFALAAGWADRYYSQAQYPVSQAYLVLFTVMYALIGLFYARNTLRQALASEGLSSSIQRVGRVDSALVFGLPITAFAIQYLMVKDFELGSALAAISYAIFYLILARFVYARQSYGLGLLAEAYLIVAGIFVTLTIPLALENAWTGAAWAIEGAGMYWLGVRQQRPYARALAFIVLLGAWSKLSFAMYFDTTPGAILLHGSWLGALILMLSSLLVWHLYPRPGSQALADTATQSAWKQKFDFNAWFVNLEAKLRQAALWLAGVALVCICWLSLIPIWAAVAQAVLGALIINLARRKLSLTDFHKIGVALQILSVVQFALTIQRNPGAGAFLASGTQGMLAAAFIAMALLFNVILAVRKYRREFLQSGEVLIWSTAVNAGLLVSGLLLQFSLLFALNLTQAASIWPVTAALSLALALYLANFVLALGAGLMFALSLVVYALSSRVYTELSPIIWNIQFAATVSLAVSLIFAAERIYQAATRGPWVWHKNHPQSSRIHNGWAHHPWVQVVPLAVGLWFWFSASSVEVARYIQLNKLTTFAGGLQLLVAIASAWLVFGLARARKWAWASYAQFIYLPWMIWVVHSQRLQALYLEQSWLPFKNWDYVIWLLIFASHLFLLRQAERSLTVGNRFLQAVHAVACWFFILLVSVQAHGLVLELSLQENAWTALAWISPSLLSVLLIMQKNKPGLWPWSHWRDFYLQKVSYPIAVFITVWFFYSALTHDGNAQPLPFISFFNPIELAQLACLLVLLNWWRNLPQLWRQQMTELKIHYGLAIGGLVWYTSLVLRSCSQYAGIPYQFDALFDAKLAQAAVSVAWALAAVISMILANRRMAKSLWIGGAVLLAVVVLKLFVIELADHGGLYRIISFIVVGLLLLVVGYFAPMPGMKKAEVKNDS